MDFQTKLDQLQTRIDQLEKDLEDKTKELVPAAAEKTELQIQIADLEKEKSELQNEDSDLKNGQLQDLGLEDFGREDPNQDRNVKNSDTEHQSLGVTDVLSHDGHQNLDSDREKEGQRRVPDVEASDGECDDLEALVEKYNRNRKRENQTCNNDEEEVQILDQVQQPSTARSDDTFRFSVTDISKLTKSVASHPTYVYGYPWRIAIKPKQDGDTKNLGFFLHCYSHISYQKDFTFSCQASVQLRVVSHKKNDFTKTKTFSHLFCAKNSFKGFSKFMSWDDLVDPENGFVKDDTVTFEAKVAICPDSLLQVPNLRLFTFQLFKT